jgi:hypothetical protein
MRRLILSLFLATAAWAAQAEAATIVTIGTSAFEVPQNGTLDLNAPITAPASGSFSITDVPTFTGSGFAVLIMNASVNGAPFTYQTSLGTCPVSFCGSFPIVVDNVFGQHLGPGGFSIFQTADINPALTVSSGWSLQSLTGNIVVPADYEVHIAVSLPAGVAAVPEPSAWAMLLIGFAAIGFASRISLRARRRAALAPD